MKKIITQSRIIILLFSILLSTATFASHIAGGVITYQCLGNNQYKVTFKFYRDCSGIAAPNPAQIVIYNSSQVQVQTLSLPLISTTSLPANAPNPCTTPPTGICIEENIYTGTVTLPPIPGGYELTFDLCCRNPGIVNGPANSSSYTTTIPDVSKAACNNSAVYPHAPPIFVCAGLPLSYDHSATDPDGDVLTYSLCSPSEQSVPYTPYPYTSPYTAANPLGGGLTINPTTGLITGTPSTLGKFVVGVCVTETRNGVVIATTTEDFQWNVVDCQVATVASALSALTNCQTKQVTFFNNSTGGVSYKWSFGDGQTFTTTSAAPLPHTYSSLGSYNITLVSYATNPACNDTVKSLVTVVDTCRPCGMNASIATTNGVCSPVAGCTKVTYSVPCTSGSYSISYAGSTVGGSCGGGSSSSSGGTPAPTTATITVGGVSIPSASTTTTYTALPYSTQATCPKAASTSWAGNVLTINVNLWMNQPQTGGATATVTGGTPPYVINWTTTPTQTGTTASGVNPGTYSCIVTDANGCTQTQTFTVNGNSTLNFTANKTDVTGCGLNNGTLSVTGVTGSTGTVTYSWSPGGWTTASVNNVPPGTYMVTVNDGAGCPKAATVTVGGVPTITVTATLTNVLCSYSTNGSATASASGGTGPYTYTWNTTPVKSGASVTGLAKGFYTVTAKDANGCTGSYSFSITSPPALTLTMSKTDPLCFQGTNGTATVSATGGTGAKTYSWSTTPVQNTATATGLKSGQYVVTVTDANGCTASNSVTLNNPPALIHDVLNTSTMSCAGVFTGKAQETASGGTGTLTYSWSCIGSTTASVTGLPVGSCTVTTKDANNCTATDVVVITNPGVLSATISSTPTCGGTNNGTALVTPVGGISPYTYSWNPGGATTQNISGLAAGSTYTATVTDKGGCTKAVSVTIASTPALVLGTTLSGCGNNVAIDLTVTGGTPAYIYTWSNGPTTQDISGLSAGTYTVTVWDANNCYATSATVVPVISCNPKVVANPVTICNGSCGTITATGSIGATPYTYKWSPATGLSATTGVSVSACPTTTTTYTITITDNVAATGNTTVTVTVNPNPSVTVPPATICAGNSTTLTATGANTYTWSPATGLSVTTGATVTANPTTTSTYTVIGTTTATGCTGSTTVMVTVNPIPTITVPPATICAGTSATLTASGASTYTWLPVTGLSATTGTSVTANPAATTTYTVTGTSAASCTGTTTVIVTVNPNPIVSVPVAAICSGASTTLNASGATTYTWAPATGLSATTDTSVTANPLTTTTYTVTGAFATGCTGSSTVTVTVNPNPTVTVPPATICAGSSATLTASGATTYTWTPATGLSATAGTSVNANPSTTTTYTVTGAFATGCTGVTTVIVTVNPRPVVTVPPATICQGNATTLTASGADTYTWSPATGLSPTTGASVTANPTVTTTYTVTGTTIATGCTGTTTVAVTVIPPCGPGITATGSTVCNGICGSVTSTATGGVPPYSYLWSNGATTSGMTPNPCPTVTTSYTVTVTDNSTPIGTASAVAVITVNPNPVVTVPGATICAGSSATLTASGATTYSWAPVTGLSSGTGTSVTANPVTTTTYTVTGSFATGCTGTTTVTVTVNPIPVVSVPSASICPGGSTILNATGATTYTWSPATGISATTGASVTANPASTITYTVVGTSAGCTGVTTVTVSVGALVANAGPDVSICSGSSTNLNASGGTIFTWTPATGLSNTTIGNPIANPTVTTTYTVTVSDGFCSDDDVVTITVDPPVSLNAAGIDVTCFGACNGQIIVIPSGGTSPYTYAWSTGCTSAACSNICAGTYTLVSTDAMGCSASASATVNQPPLLTMALSGHTNVSCFGVCDGTATVSANGGTGSYSYSWTPAGGNATNASGLCAGSYTCTVADANGCTATTSVIITQPTAVIVSSSGATICPNACANLTASCSGGTGPFAFSWNPGGSTGSTASVCPTVTTTYTIIATDANGCTGSTSVVVTVQPTPTISVAPATICQGTSTTLSATGASSYTWSPATGLNPTTGSTVTANPITTITYTVIGTSAFGCTNSTTVTVTVNLAPALSATGGAVCPGEDTTLTASGANSYTWSPAGSLSPSTGAVVNAHPTSTTTYTITGTGTNGCTSTITSTVTVHPKPIADFTSYPNPTDMFNPTVSFYDNSVGAVTWLWHLGDVNNTTSTTKNTSFKYPDSVANYTVTLIVTSAFGCIDTTSTIVYVKGIYTFYIPNTFTPDADGVNDLFMPKGTGIDESDYDLWIFDRWGNLIWHTRTWGEGWDGRANYGKDVAQIDTYVWKVHVKEKESGLNHNYIGHVNIIK